MRYFKLGDDLDLIIEGYETNANLSDYQRQQWYRDGKKKAVTHEMFGIDRDNALRLDNGELVGSFAANSARRFWDYGEGHVFPPMEDIIRFGIFMHLDWYRILALALKNEWEHYFAHEVKSWRANKGDRLIDVIFDADEQEIRNARRSFNPDGEQIFKLLLSFALSSSLEQETIDESLSFPKHISIDSFLMIVQEMILGGYYRGAHNSPELNLFISQKQQEHRMLTLGTPEQQREFELEKSRWIQMKGEIEDLYFHIESQRLRNAHTKREWLSIFGNEEVTLMEAIIRYEAIDSRYNLKRANPDWTRSDIEQQVAHEEVSRGRELRDLRTDAAIAPHLIRNFEGGTGGGNEELTAYVQQCKYVLRTIRKLSHPDQLEHNPAYRKLTETQKEKLTTMLLTSLEIRPEELGWPEGYVLHDMRSLDGLNNVLSRVKAILGNPGVDIDESLQIQGETIPDKLEWLITENTFLDEEIDSAKAELQALAEDDETRKRRSILDFPENHDTIINDFRKRTDDYLRKAERLETDFETLFS